MAFGKLSSYQPLSAGPFTDSGYLGRRYGEVTADFAT